MDAAYSHLRTWHDHAADRLFWWPASADLCCLLTARLVFASLPLHGAEPPSFERDARPIFKTYCLDCHGGGEELEGSLDLRLR